VLCIYGKAISESSLGSHTEKKSKFSTFVSCRSPLFHIIVCLHSVSANKVLIKNQEIGPLNRDYCLRPFQFCTIPPLSYNTDQLRLLFWRSMSKSDNNVLRTLAYLNQVSSLLLLQNRVLSISR